jgi:ribosomal protein S18 acetylase RimI-like enzyme
VRSDNPACAFYERFGFRERRRVPLRRSDDGAGVRWHEEPSSPDDGISLVHMELETDGR